MHNELTEEAKADLRSLQLDADAIGEAIRNLNVVNTGPLRCRELSVAITELQGGLLWLEHMIRETSTT